MTAPLSDSSQQLIGKFEAYLLQQKYDPTTTKNRVRSLRAFIQRWEARYKRALGGVTAEQIEEVLKEAARLGRSKETLADELKALRAFFRMVMTWGKLKENPAEGIRAPGDTKKSRRRKKKITKHDIMFAADDEENEYLTSAARGGSRQDGMHRIIAEHKEFGDLATKASMLATYNRDIEEKLDKLKQEIEISFAQQSVLLEQQMRIQHGVLMAMILAAVAKASQRVVDPVDLWDAGTAFFEKWKATLRQHLGENDGDQAPAPSGAKP